MSKEFVAKVCDPFVTTRTTRKVGMGISLFKASAEISGGSFSIDSQEGKGTTVTAVFDVSCIDCPPLGDITGTMVSQFVCHQDIDFRYIFTTENGTMEFDTRIVKQVLGGVGLDTPEVMQWMLQSIKQELAEIGADKV
jgi:nitrogen fixation/metabolism regulation signal transduction histidine kinase